MAPHDPTAIAGQLYEGALDPGGWHAAIDAINQAVEGFRFHQITVDHALGMVVDSVASPSQPEDVETYERHYAMVDDRLPIVMGLKVGQIMLDHEHFSPRAMAHSPIYAEWLASLGMKHTMVLMQRSEGSLQEYVGFMRHLDQVAFGPRQRALAQQLMPDLVRASRLRAHAAQLARQAALGLSALNSLQHGIAVVDVRGRIHYTNAAADRIFATAAPLRSAHGMVECADGDARDRLRALIAAACRTPAKAGALQLQMALRRLTITVLPVKPDHRLSATAPSACREQPLALLVLGSPDSVASLDPAVVGDMLGLSPAETRLALLLASGKTIKDFAAIESTSWHTARSHLKNLMRKTGAHRQSDVVGLLQSLRLG